MLGDPHLLGTGPAGLDSSRLGSSVTRQDSSPHKEGSVIGSGRDNNSVFGGGKVALPIDRCSVS